MELSKYIEAAPNDLELIGKDKGLQLLKIYAFNAYFNADPLFTDEVNDGCTYRRDNKYGIDGVYINESLEENTIECLYSYYVGSNPFVLNEILNALVRISSEIEDVAKRKFVNNDKADNLLSRYLEESDNKKIIIRIITDYICDPNEKYQLNKKIENYSVKADKLNVSAVLVLGDDVETVIASNKAPFDYVEEGKLSLDQKDNYLKYEDHSIICNISAKSLKKLWEEEGNRGLLAMNLRYYVKSTNIDNKIEDSIIFDNKDFWYLNNGIIIVCNDYKIKDNEVLLRQFSIVNGGQTSRMIGTIPFEGDFYISCKIIKNIFENSQDKNVFISKVAEASNTQKPIKAKDIIANRIEQRNLKTLMQDNGVFIEIKRGEKCNKELYPEVWQRTKNNELAQDLYAFVYMEPGPARNSVSSILQNNDKYNVIFKEHTYSFDFLKDIIFLEKSYKEYQKKVSKEESIDLASATKKGLVKNGLWYCLATIGYVLKLIYNSEYAKNMYQYRNQESLNNLYLPELAFMHSFIDKKIDYKIFKQQAFTLFDTIFTELIIRQFEISKEMNPELAYSNWMKTNTGFKSIRGMINIMTFDNKQDYLIRAISKYFIPISDDEINANIDRYVDYCKKNKKIISKNNDGYALSQNDEALRNELMVYRLDYSNKVHIAESKVFTDKTLDKIVVEKPLTISDLKKIVNYNTAYYCGTDLIKIIVKHL
jgi:hypothetical protein